MSRPGEARLAKVKRRASVPKAGDAFREFLLRLLGDALRLLRIHQADRALFDQRVEADAVDQVDRVEHVALRLRHLLAFAIADQAMHIDVLERDLAGDLLGHHDHAGHPEEDDVETGDQHGRRQILLQNRIGGVDGGIAGPVQRRERPQGGREPGVEDVLVTLQGAGVALPGGLGAGFFLAMGNEDLAVGRRTTPESGGPTTVGGKYTSPGCCSATGCRY